MGSKQQLLLKDVCELIVDCPHSTAKDEGEGYPLIRTPNIGPGYLDLNAVHRVSREVYERRNARATPQYGDIILAREAPAGNAGIVLEGQQVCLGQRTVLIRPNNKVVSPLFMNYYLNAPQQRRYLLNSANGATVSHVNMSAIRMLPISLPSRDQQDCIASILGAMDELIRINRQTNDYLAETALSIWKRYVQQSSEHMTIGEAAKEVITGKTPPTKRTELYGSDYPFITIPDMHGNVWFTSTERCLSEDGNKAQPKKIVNRGTVLVSCIATLGLVGIVSKPSHFNQQINAVVPKRAGEEYFLYCALLSVKQTLLGIGATGSATLNVNKGAFSGIDIPWLDDKSMDEYIQTVRPLFEAIEANSNECLRLTSLRDTLLPKLMSGEIDVSGIEAPMQPNNHLTIEITHE